MHHHNVGEIVADERDLFRRRFRIRHDLVENGNLLDVPLIDVVHLALARAFHHGGRVASADHAGAHAHPLAPLQCDAILRIEAFEFDDGAGSVRQEVHLVAKNAIHVHEQDLDFRCALAYFRGYGYQLTFVTRRFELGA